MQPWVGDGKVIEWSKRMPGFPGMPSGNISLFPIRGVGIVDS